MLDLKALFNKILNMFKIHTATVNGSTGALHLYRTGNVVFFSTNGAFRSSASTIGNNTNLSQTIPYGFRPVVTTYIGFAHQAANNARFEFRNGGSIGFYGTAAWNYNAYVSGMWVTNDAMPSNGGGVFNLQTLRNILTPRKVVGVC